MVRLSANPYRNGGISDEKNEKIVCSGSGSVDYEHGLRGLQQQETYISFDEVYNQLTSSIDFSASKMQKQTEAALNNYYYIDPATLEDYAIYMADYATGNADEIAMFQVKESDQMTTVKSLINDRISDLKVRYEDYKPEEMPKIESAIIEEKGNYIFLVISPDNEKAQEVLDQLLG